ncbi:MAG: SRPBCC family protein [Bacteroidia bacterium]|nr:SRPBCC family protein [Bacteroidia bacterium]
MSVHFFKASQKLPISQAEAWEFISSPANLKELTPVSMGMKITGDHPRKMFAGQIITYTLKPVANIPMHWMTEISHVSEPHFFVDEQRSGPYKLWNHKHFLKDIPGGVQIDDTVHYSLPLGLIGDLANLLFVKKKLEDIFEYRKKRMEEIFGIYTLINE